MTKNCANNVLSDHGLNSCGIVTKIEFFNSFFPDFSDG